MTFFNKKEEILEIKLSSYGKQKLAAGSFKPVYYAFFDDDILYDGARAGIVEDGNDIEPRIQENSPSSRVQTSFTDLEKRVKKQTHDIANETYHERNVTDLKFDPSVFQDYDGLRNVLPLGNSQLGNKHIASWRLEFLEGNYKASKSTTIDTTSDLKPIINIPQLTSDVKVQPVLIGAEQVTAVDPKTERYAAVNNENNSYIRVTNDYILLDVTENNVDLLNDSFEIEVYEVVINADGEELLYPKMFKKDIHRIVNGILLDEKEIDSQISEVEVDQNFSEYYFDISFDDSIDNKTKFDKIVSREKRGNLFDNNVGCEDYQQTRGSELYTSDNDGDEC
tara:strand:- start:8646 stop:9656 length:1011 start_codon:yes stop_codon:yes gene_type:complete